MSEGDTTTTTATTAATTAATTTAATTATTTATATYLYHRVTTTATTPKPPLLPTIQYALEHLLALRRLRPVHHATLRG